MAFAYLVAMPAVALAGDARVQFTVMATVAAHVSLEAVSQPAVLSVTEADVARGYVDVTASYHVRNNDPAGYVVRLEPAAGFATSVVIAGLASPVVLRDEVVEVTEAAALVPRALNLSFRIMLRPDLRAGDYGVPLRVSAATL